MTIIVGVSALLLLAMLAAGYLRSQGRTRTFVIPLIVLCAYLALLHFAFGFPSPPELLQKGESNSNSWPLILALFLFMLLGMGAEYVFHLLDSDSTGVPFDWKTFAQPFLISPMVFMPIAASLQNAALDLSHFNIPLLMLFLVAFENGFLWRAYFSRKMSQPRTRAKRSA